MFKETISVPGVTLRYLIKVLPMGVMFRLCVEKHKDLNTTMSNNITDGLSIIFHRYHENNKTWIRGNEDKVVQSFKGLDANVFYLNALMQPMESDWRVYSKAEYSPEWAMAKLGLA